MDFFVLDFVINNGFIFMIISSFVLKINESSILSFPGFTIRFINDEDNS